MDIWCFPSFATSNNGEVNILVCKSVFACVCKFIDLEMLGQKAVDFLVLIDFTWENLIQGTLEPDLF